MNLFIHRNGQQFGPYTLEQANAYLMSGNLLQTDLAWHEGAPQWVPLSSLQGIHALPPPPPPPTSPRSVGKLILMAVMWFIVFWFGILMAAGAIAGAFDPKHGYDAGARAGQIMSAPALMISLLLSIGLTVAGKLPGTRKD